jgi:glutathione S-transferase
MQLYCAPLACSMAARISLYEAGAKAEFVYVDIHTDPKARRLADGSDYYAINPMGQVPAVRTDDGALLTENPVVLQYIGDQYPESGLTPAAGLERYRLQEWLNFTGTELHKATFIPLLNRDNPESVREYAGRKLALRFGRLEAHLRGRDTLLDRFTVADAYLFTVLNWAPYAQVNLADWPNVRAYYQALSRRPSISRALAEEAKLYADEQARRAAA